MKLISAAAVAASILCQHGFVSAAPLTLEEVLEITTLGGMTFKINQVPNPRFSGVRSGPLAIARAYGKFGISIPDDLLSIIEQLLSELRGGKGGGNSNKGQNSTQGEVAAVPTMFDTEYLCPVMIGTPPQTLNLDFDTGSSDLWVFSSDTPTTQVQGQTIFNTKQSSTAKLMSGATWSISYGDGSNSKGIVYSDKVSIGGVTVENQAIESAQDVSLSFSQNPDSDGLLGLAFSTLNTVQPTRQKTFFDNAMKELASPLFTANLKRGEAGNYNFGFIDKTEFMGQMSFVPVNTSSGFWQFTAAGFQVGSNLKAVMAPHEAIADTGTTLLLLPADISEAYYSQVEGAQNSAQAGGFIFPCNSTLPDYTALIGDHQAVIPGDFMKFAPVDGSSFDTATTCFGGIQAIPSNIPFAIYGDVFLKSQFVVFSGGNNQLGFAAKPL